MAATPWQTADIPGPKLAMPIKPVMCARLLKTGKRALLIVGGSRTGNSKSGSELARRLIELTESLKTPIVASPGIYKDFAQSNSVPVFCMGTVDLVNHLKDSKWTGLDSKGHYDLVVFVGGIYYFHSLMLSTLKHFAPRVRTVSIDRFFQPNADFSLENMDEKDWMKSLDSMINILRN